MSRRARARRGGRPRGGGGVAPALAGVLQQAVAQHQAGNLAVAAAGYQQVLDEAPDQPDALHLLGVVHHQSGDHRKAAELIGRSVRGNPANAEAHANLGAALAAAGDLDGAARSFRQAIKLDPEAVGAYANLAALSVRRGADDEAIRNFRAAHRLNPGEPRFLKRLAELYLAHEQFDDAVDWFDRYLSMTPDDAEAHNNAAFALQGLGRLADAESHFRRAMALDPGKPEIGNNLAGILRRLGKVEEADRIFERILELDPRQWDDLSHYAGALFNGGFIDKALALFETLSLERPDDAVLYRDFGKALYLAGRNDDAKAALRRALSLDSSLDGARIDLAHCHLRDREIEPAIATLQSVETDSPNYLAACLDLSLVYAGSDRIEEACTYARQAARHPDFRPSMFVKPYTVYRRACAFDDIEALPDSMAAVDDKSLSTWANLFLELLVHSNTEARIGDLVTLHRRWGDRIMKAVEPLAPADDTAPRVGKMRLGFVSSDLRKHSVARFVLPLFENYDREGFDIFCYSPSLDEADEIQRRIRGCVTEFRVIGSQPHHDVAETIRQDRIDILFELNGFTADSRLTVMAYRPAPVQVYWLGYPFTTGLSAMDYILLDGDIAPTHADDWLAETPLLMPGSWVCYEPFEVTAPAPEPPAVRNGHVTFGTLNSPYKFTRAGLATWARVMAAVSGSRMLLVHPEFGHRAIVENLTREFGRHGIAPDRLEFIDNRDNGVSHFAYYDRIDISLDTTPLTGGTTTTDSLWMGVPVVTRVGPALHQRLSRGVLAKVGLGELCATSEEDFVATAVALAGDMDRLSALRRDLRGRMQASPLCNGRDFCRSFETLMLDVARRHGLRA